MAGRKITDEERIAAACQIIGALAEYAGVADRAEVWNVLAWLNGESDAKHPLPFQPYQWTRDR